MWALVTGATSGIGAEFTKLLAKEHYNIILVARDEIRLKKAAEELEKEFGKDLWDKSSERQRGKGTTEDLYWWYKKQCKMGQTPSELAIVLNRTTTRGLR